MKRFKLAPLVAATVVLLGAQLPCAARASSITYDVTMSAILGPESGGGSFTITTPQVGSGGVLNQLNGLTALNFTIDGVNFGLDSTSSVAYFYQGSALVLAGLVYGGQVGTDALLSITLGSTGGYTFTDSAKPSLDTIGSASVSQTPLPTSFPLLATGLGILAMIGWWRKRETGSFFGT